MPASALVAPPRPVPGPRPLPLLGSRLDLLRFFADPIRHLLALSELGSVAAMSAGNDTLVFAFGAAHNHTVLSDPSTFRNAVEVPFPLPPGSAATRIFRGVMSMNGEEHRRHRRLLLPVLTKAAVARYSSDIVELSERQVEQWARTPSFDLGPACGELTSAVLMRCLFDTEGRGEGERMAAAGGRLLSLFTSPFTIALPWRLPGSPYARFIDTCEEVERDMRQMVATRGAQEAEGRDVMSILLRARDEDQVGLGEDQVIAHLISMVFAGQDTIASTLAVTLLLLTQFPDQAHALKEELDAVLGGAPPSPEDLARLPLLDGVVNESMRLLPAIVHLLFKRPDAPIQLGEHRLPAGATIILSPLITHRDPAVFPDPLGFDPLRWQGPAPGPYAWMPFGAGPRTCVGASLSSYILRVQLAMIVQRFRPELVAGTRVDLMVRAANLLFRGPVPVRLRPWAGARARGGVERLDGDVRRLVRLG